MSSQARTIAIIGGGFSGTALAARLLRAPPASPTRLILFERAREVGRGVAYAQHAHPYLLNVPAGRMSAISEDPDHLVRYARQYQSEANAESFLTRAFYGQYLQHYLSEAERSTASHLQLERVRCEVTGVHPLDLKGAVVIRSASRQWLADQVVLACGEPPPMPKSYASEVADHEAYQDRPLALDRLGSSRERVLLIGTGPTMVDVAVALAAANPGIELVAISRHGLLPQPQTVALGAHGLSDGSGVYRCARGATLRQIVASIRVYIEALKRQGVDWRDALVGLRKSVPALWASLGEADRRRFLRHVRAYWDIHRHRLAPDVALAVTALKASGQLRIHAGRIVRLMPVGAKITAQWRARGSEVVQRLSADRIIDCSGHDGRLRETQDPLLRHLLDSGIGAVDPVGLGLRTAEHGALINADGDTARQLFYLGPMLRAAHWEATAVGELRQRVDALADALREFPADRRAPVSRYGAPVSVLAELSRG